MLKGELDRDRRTLLMNRMSRLDAMLYPDDDTLAPTGERRARTKAAYFRTLEEYSERLQRVVMSVCPFTGQPLERAYDRFGTDGPWWHKDLIAKFKEPPAPLTFKVLLGALNMKQRTPVEVTTEVTPGPEVPFVVPRLLSLPGMVAVIGELKVETGDTAYPIAYFSEDDIPHERLHQFWLRQDYWFKTEAGEASWIIANDPWDFDLQPWIDKKKVWWMSMQKGKPVALSKDSGAPCPYVNLPGDRLPQVLSFGERALGELPSGVPVSPFET